jgi:hypothetical protein
MKAQQIRVVFQHFREGDAVVYYSTTLERKVSGGVRHIIHLQILLMEQLEQVIWSASWITKSAIFLATVSLETLVSQCVASWINKLFVI